MSSDPLSEKTCREQPSTLGLACLCIALLLAGCGIPGQQAPAPETPTLQASSRPTDTKPAPRITPRPSPAAKDLQSRIGDSLNRTVLPDKKALSSYHIEVTGTEPRWNQQTKQVETFSYTLKADVAGDDMYLIYTSKTGTKPAQTTEGYMIKGGLSKKDQGGKEYVVSGGKLKETIGDIGLTWAFFPLSVGIPLAIAATGPEAAGSESIDGRDCDKFNVDSAKAPPGVVGALGTLIAITSAKGTAWVDKETGALLKLILDYQQDLFESPGSKTVVGKGNGHIDLLVTKVGKVTVKLPQ